MLDVDVQTLKQVPLFQDVDARHLKLIAFVAERLTFEEGEQIFELGDPADAVYVVLNGSIDVMAEARDGTETVIKRWTPGFSFGEMGVLVEPQRTMSARAHECSIVLRIGRSDFLNLLSEVPPLALAVMRNLARRLDGMIKKYASTQVD